MHDNASSQNGSFDIAMSMTVSAAATTTGYVSPPSVRVWIRQGAAVIGSHEGAMMEIRNTMSNRNLYWRIHPRSDPDGVGIREGIAAPGVTVPYQESTRPLLTVDLRKDNLLGDPIEGWGRKVKWNCTKDSVLIVGDGSVQVEDASTALPADPASIQAIKVVNQMFIDIHIVVVWGGVVQEVQNNVKPGETATLGGSSYGLHDLYIIPGWSEGSAVTEAERQSWDEDAAAKLAVTGVGIALAVGSAIVSFGMTAPALATSAALLSKALAVSSLLQTGASLLAEGLDGIPAYFLIGGVPGTAQDPVIVCTGAKTFGSSRGSDFVIEAVSPYRASLWTGRGGSMREERFGSGDLFHFYPDMDSGGNDIGQLGRGMTTVEMRRLAATMPEAVAFNTSGWFKRVVRPSSEWYRVGSNQHGLYVKVPTPPPA